MKCLLLFLLPVVSAVAADLRGSSRRLRALRSGLQETPASGTAEEAWNYADHGKSWYRLGECGSLEGQSPIDVYEAGSVAADDGQSLFYRFDAYTRPLRMENDGRRLSAEVEGEAGIIALGHLFPTQLNASYSLRQIRIRSPSEHTYLDAGGRAGKRVPLELQLVHRGGFADGAGEAEATVALGFVPALSAQSPFLDALRQGGLPDAAGASSFVNRQAPAELAFSELFMTGDGGRSSFWEYEGSATEPPCSSGVRWFVRQDPLPASNEAISAFVEAIAAVASIGQDADEVGNARELQVIGGRTVLKRQAKDASQADSGAPINATFENAAQEAEDAIAQAQKALGIATSKAGGAAGADTAAGTSAAAGAQRVVQSGSSAEICARNLQRTYDELAASEGRERAECLAVQEMNATASTASASSAQPVLLRNQEVLCEQERKVLDALRRQAKSQQAECDRIAARG
eukprot:TRINITY_DN26576_c0_g1_i1.p1 TRINITY_DN26576_c0_g1~~TRINITY_DN26576_c0_g1_i1.p1  ORF type:complete len:489 (+),score=111.92 TRINITY_DN26576_c0_g1_i1:86-1468(+)